MVESVTLIQAGRRALNAEVGNDHDAAAPFDFIFNAIQMPAREERAALAPDVVAGAAGVACFFRDGSFREVKRVEFIRSPVI